MALLEAKKLGISFGGLRAVDDFNISIECKSRTTQPHGLQYHYRNFTSAQIL